MTYVTIDGLRQSVQKGKELLEALFPDTVLPEDTTLTQSKYNFDSRTFPSDIGTGYQGHFIVLNINVQTRTLMNRLNGNPDLSFEVLPEQLSTTDALRYSIDKTWTSTTDTGQTQNLGVSNEYAGLSSRARFTRRIAESIALYMPNSELTFSDAHDFENISLTKFAGSTISGVGEFVGAIIGRSGIGSLINAVGDVAGRVAQYNGAPINPKVEVLFANTFQREFAFEFLFSPSNEKEAKDLENIIRTIRFHAAPEYVPSTAQFFWLAPSEFDISFYYINRDGDIEENRKIPRINTCVLKQIDVSYAPSGAYSTFHDGNPVQIRMVLRFIETEVNSKLRIAQGF